MLRQVLCFSCLWLGLLGSSRLQAQPHGAEQYGLACDKLETSEQLDPAVGTLLDLAECYEKLGRTASAWATFRETSARARKAGVAERERERIARERAQSLESRLSYLTIIAWKGQEVTIQRDGVALDPAVLGTALAVDPGVHEIAAGAPGKRTWHTHVDVHAHADRVSVSVPILGDEPTSGPVSAAPLAAAGAGALQHTALGHAQGEDTASDTGGTQRTLALVAAALGVAGVATGAVFGLKAASNWSDAKDQCPSSRFRYAACPDNAVRLSDESGHAGTISTVSFIVGGAGAAAAAALWLTAPSAPQDTRLSFALAPFEFDLHGNF